MEGSLGPWKPGRSIYNYIPSPDSTLGIAIAVHDCDQQNMHKLSVSTACQVMPVQYFPIQTNHVQSDFREPNTMNMKRPLREKVDAKKFTEAPTLYPTAII